MNKLFTAAFAAASFAFAVAPAMAAPSVNQDANCYLEDEGKVYMNGYCTLRWLDKKGSFIVSDEYVEGMVAKDNTGVTTGAYYSTDKNENKVSGTFNVMHRKGTCWQNKTQRVCVGKMDQNVMPARTLRGVQNFGD
jgi:hypothetical protein